MHVIDAGDIPRVEILIECSGTIEHLNHTGDTGNIPGTEILVEYRCFEEHLLHVCNTGYIPTKGLIKSIDVNEGVPHTSDLTYVPACDFFAISEVPI